MYDIITSSKHIVQTKELKLYWLGLDNFYNAFKDTFNKHHTWHIFFTLKGFM